MCAKEINKIQTDFLCKHWYCVLQSPQHALYLQQNCFFSFHLFFMWSLHGSAMLVKLKPIVTSAVFTHAEDH